MLTAAYSQEKLVNYQTKTISGTVMNTDFVGNTISILTEDQHHLSFSVPAKAIITQETHKIGLMDIGKSDSVTIQYYTLSSPQYTVVSILDNESIVNE